MASAAMREGFVTSPQPATTPNSSNRKNGNQKEEESSYKYTADHRDVDETKETNNIQREDTKDIDRSTDGYYRQEECSRNGELTKDCLSNKNTGSNTEASSDENSKLTKALRSARKNSEDMTRKLPNSTKFICPVCSRSDFVNVYCLQSHIDDAHPEYEEKEIGRLRKNLKIPKVIGFQDLNFIDFSSAKFPLVAKNICEERLHLSKDDFSFDCIYCGRSFPCEKALEIHVVTCKTRPESNEDKFEKKNKRKSTPKFHPQNNDSSDSDDFNEKRNDFFSSLNLRNTEPVPQPDLADIQSIISVTNIGLNNVPEPPPPPPAPASEKQISPENEEEQQDCFAAECRKMKLRGEFPCKLCTAIFPNLRALKGHNRVHISIANGTPSSPYRCNICTYISLDKATLVRHMRSHNGDRPYECSICNYAFTTKANCERHLRNRHCKVTREEVKNSIIYHPSEDPINDSDYQKFEKAESRKSVEPMNLKVTDKEDLFRMEHQELLRNIENKETMTEETKEPIRVISPQMINNRWADYNEEALDLSMNRKESDSETEELPQDLSKSSEEFNNNENEVKKATSEDTKSNFDFMNLVKVYSTMYPALTVPQIHQIILTQLNFPAFFQRLNYALPPFYVNQGFNQNFGKPEFYKNETKEKQRGLQLTSGGNILNENMSMTEKLQLFQQQALVEMMNKRERITNDYYKQDNEKQKPVDYYNDKNKRIDKEIKEDKDRNTSVKMVIKNGVLMPKQKQRRYRTERPFSCEHCSARFTLRSNMERHIKQQHPQYWIQKSRSNVGSTKKEKDENSRDFKLENQSNDYRPLNINSLSVLSRDRTYPSGGEMKWDLPPSAFKNRDIMGNEMKKDEENNDLNLTSKDDSDFTDEEEETKDDLIIDEEKEEAEKLKFKMEDLGDHHRNHRSIPDLVKVELRTDNKDMMRENQPQDLASVSRMLDNAVTQTQAFQKYFQDGRNNDDCKREGDSSSGESRRDEGDRSEEEEGLVAGSTSSDENKSESESSNRNTKKKSAYSLAPNRVSCPYCFRKFPWTSSLRRHVLTHTGQKPFKCTHCPLLFTTKSNCDRHLLRKHGREALAASCGQTENNSGNSNNNNNNNNNTANNSLSQSQNNNYSMRNVPERPYKCSHCPSSTFSTVSNLNKHVSSKHGSPYSSSDSSEMSKFKNPTGPPNVTISPSFPLNIPKNLSILSNDNVQQHYPNSSKPAVNLNIPNVKVQDWNWVDHDERKISRKRSSSEEIEVCDRKRLSPDPDIKSGGEMYDSERSNTDGHRCDVVTLQASDLPFKCHLCERSFSERNEALDHIRLNHPSEFQLLESKGALESNLDDEKSQQEEHDEMFDGGRGRFPDYANRKVVCAFCMRRFWSAEDLRRHMRTHTGERPFSCDVCQRRFTLKHSMLRHRKKHSSGDETQVVSDEEHPKVQINHNNNNLPTKVVELENDKNSEINKSKRNDGGDLISNLLGIKDNSIIEQVLVTKNPSDAAKLLGVRK